MLIQPFAEVSDDTAAMSFQVAAVLYVEGVAVASYATEPLLAVELPWDMLLHCESAPPVVL